MRSLILFLSFCICSITYAQQFKVEDIGALKDTKNDYDVINVTNGFIAVEYATKKQMAFTFSLSKLKYSVKLIRYDEKLKIVKEVGLSGGDRVYGPFIPFLKKINNKIFLFYHKPSDNDSEIDLYASELDETTLEQKTPKKILTIDQKNLGLFNAIDLFDNQKLVVEYFPNYQKTIVAWSAGVNNEMYISVIDQNMDMLWSMHEKITDGKQIKILNACLDKNGTAFISYTNEYKKDKRSFLYLVKQGATATNIELLVEGGIVSNAFVWPGDNDVMITGTYMENSDDLLTGAFSQHINATDFAINDKLKSRFPETLVEQFKNDSYGSKKDFGISGNSDFEHVVMPDGSVSMSADFNRYRDVGQVREMITGSILHIWFRKDGIVFTRIPKSEVPVFRTTDPPNLFYPFSYKDKMMLLYNDRHQPVEGSNEKSTRNDNHYSQLIVAIIERNGTVTRKELRDASFKYDILGLAVDKVRSINNSVLMLPTLNNRMGILKIEN